MPSQQDYLNVKQLVIDPMLRLYQPPMHLRTDKTAFAAMLEEYQTKLSGFARSTLEKAWEAVKDEHETWLWPHLKILRDACVRFAPADRPADSTGQHPWVARDEQAADMTRQFMESFAHSQLMQTARSEGWERPLHAYALTAARCQASMITGNRAHGYSNAVYRYGTDSQGEAVNQRIAAFIANCRTQAAKGVIGVEVPNEAIECWRRHRAVA